MSRIPTDVSGDAMALRAAVQRVTAPTLEFSVPPSGTLADRYTLPDAPTLAELREFVATWARAGIYKGLRTGTVRS